MDYPQLLLKNLSQPKGIADFESRYAPARYQVPRKNVCTSTFRRVAGKSRNQRQKAGKLKLAKKADALRISTARTKV
jgi:hypothetical protein